MHGAARVAGDGHQRGGALPLFLAVLFLVAGMLLYVTSTIPAQRERELLNDKQAEIQALRDRLETLLGSWRGREHAMEEDLETLLVEIDSRNLVPEDLLPDVHVRMPAPLPRAQKAPPKAKPATDPNATDPNATDPKATDPKATDPKATDQKPTSDPKKAGDAKTAGGPKKAGDAKQPADGKTQGLGRPRSFSANEPSKRP